MNRLAILWDRACNAYNRLVGAGRGNDALDMWARFYAWQKRKFFHHHN